MLLGVLYQDLTNRHFATLCTMTYALVYCMFTTSAILSTTSSSKLICARRIDFMPSITYHNFCSNLQLVKVMIACKCNMGDAWLKQIQLYLMVAALKAMGGSPVGMLSEPQLHQVQMLRESHLDPDQEHLA